jgi:hypothetical protein
MMTDAIRAVVDAARMLRADVKRTGEEPDASLTVGLWSAVDALEDVLSLGGGMPNAPYGFTLTRPWELVPMGWFVKTPKGEWFEIVGTHREGALQRVTMRSPNGKEGTFPRNPAEGVSCRRGTHTKELSDAIEALSGVFGKVAIESDEPPWDEEK